MLQRLKQSNILSININSVNSSPLEFHKIWSTETKEQLHKHTCIPFVTGRGGESNR